MEISKIGEFGLIEIIRKKIKNSKDVVKGIGDDAAVLKLDDKSYLLFTTDTLVEDVHFSLRYFKPGQIGAKAIEQNVSDIGAMGGIPRYILVSLGLPKNTEESFVSKLYDGMIGRCNKYNVEIAGGNITKSEKFFVTISLVGFVEKKFLALRSGAKKGDLVFCSGNVGKSAAGFELLSKGIYGKSIKSHLEPKSRFMLARKLVKIGISSMIDVSDGVASEIRHICEESKVGAMIYADKLPISKETIEDSKKVGKDAVELALYGGEDFELVFTADKIKLNQLKKLDVKAIGEIVDKRKGIKLKRNGKKIDLGKGFEHF